MASYFIIKKKQFIIVKISFFIFFSLLRNNNFYHIFFIYCHKTKKKNISLHNHKSLTNMNILVISLSLSLSRIYISLIGAVINCLSSCSMCRFVALVQSCERETKREKTVWCSRRATDRHFWRSQRRFPFYFLSREPAYFTISSSLKALFCFDLSFYFYFFPF